MGSLSSWAQIPWRTRRVHCPSCLRTWARLLSSLAASFLLRKCIMTPGAMLSSLVSALALQTSPRSVYFSTMSCTEVTAPLSSPICPYNLLSPRTFHLLPSLAQRSTWRGTWRCHSHDEHSVCMYTWRHGFWCSDSCPDSTTTLSNPSSHQSMAQTCVRSSWSCMALATPPRGSITSSTCYNAHWTRVSSWSQRRSVSKAKSSLALMQWERRWRPLGWCRH
mmetsp:Transcript_52489/g.113895  ORF Transcript_52489/g.113895 Transcript_52489/m.113895 type:complete len:221 (+) Transcript_52489:274-936(+)